MTGSHKVVGSIPISSTKSFKGLGSQDILTAFLILGVYTDLYIFLENSLTCNGIFH